MKKYVWITTIIVLLTLLMVTGCSIVPGAEVEQKEKAEPLDAAAWPTPQSSPTRAKPTPFPIITLEPTATPNSQSAEVVEATPTPLSAGGMSFSGSVDDLQAQVSALTGGFEPVAAAFVTSPTDTVRQGPSANSGQLGTVEAGELAGVLGTNSGSDWLYVITISGTQGWLPTNSLRVTGSLENAPVLPDNPVAAAVAGGSQSQSSAPGAAVAAETSLEELQPVASATVNNESLNVRQGPGAGYSLLTTLTQGDTVSILAINTTRDWVLVSAEDEPMGWVSLPFLSVEGDISQAPQIASAAPGNGIAATTPAAAASPVSGEAGTGFSIPALTGLATGKVVQPESKLYREPASDATAMSDVPVDVNVSILAVNADRSWALVKPEDKTPGWVPVSALEISGSLAEAPSVETAWVESNGVEVRSGPGLYYNQVGTLAVNDVVALLGQSENQGWALVKPILGGGVGWTTIHYLDIPGSWNDVPKLANDILAGEAPSAASVPVVPAPIGNPAGTLALQIASGGDIELINADGSGLRRLTGGIDPGVVA